MFTASVFLKEDLPLIYSIKVLLLRMIKREPLLFPTLSDRCDLLKVVAVRVYTQFIIKGWVGSGHLVVVR